MMFLRVIMLCVYHIFSCYVCVCTVVVVMVIACFGFGCCGSCGCSCCRCCCRSCGHMLLCPKPPRSRVVVQLSQSKGWRTPALSRVLMTVSFLRRCLPAVPLELTRGLREPYRTSWKKSIFREHNEYAMTGNGNY